MKTNERIKLPTSLHACTSLNELPSIRCYHESGILSAPSRPQRPSSMVADMDPGFDRIRIRYSRIIQIQNPFLIEVLLLQYIK